MSSITRVLNRLPVPPMYDVIHVYNYGICWGRRWCRRWELDSWYYLTAMGKYSLPRWRFEKNNIRNWMTFNAAVLHVICTCFGNLGMRNKCCVRSNGYLVQLCEILFISLIHYMLTDPLVMIRWAICIKQIRAINSVQNQTGKFQVITHTLINLLYWGCSDVVL